jgi:pyrimidine deaminase RibD-like protein
MEQHDRKFMLEAIKLASQCDPMEDSIPKVGAILAVETTEIGRGQRGTGKEGDDQHAEWHAINRVQDKGMLTKATLYTTLEPCTGEVRSKPLECCLELIRQHHVKKVFVGILDPNQGVTGKGLLRLQEDGVEVALFPHDLSKQIRAYNAPFIRSQQTLGATIVAPVNGAELHTYESAGKHTVRFKCLNPPGDSTYLLIYQNGSYWPQPGQFHKVAQREWRIDAHFGSVGEFDLQLVTANDLGTALIRYYRKVVQLNTRRREQVRDKLLDLSLLGGDYPGIEMNGHPKGLRLEASVTVNVVPKIKVTSVSVDSSIAAHGRTLKVTYTIECSANGVNVWLGASFQDKTSKYWFNTNQDKVVSLKKGTMMYDRPFTIARDAPLGEHMLRSGVWRGPVSNSAKSTCVARGTPVPIIIKH